MLGSDASAWGFQWVNGSDLQNVALSASAARNSVQADAQTANLIFAQPNTRTNIKDAAQAAAQISSRPAASQTDQSGTQSSAQSAPQTVTHRFVVYYSLSDIAINERYLDNAQKLAEIRHYLQTSPKIDGITVYSYSSPEGSYAGNLALAQKRAEAARQLILKSLPAGSTLTKDKINLQPVAENWDGLVAEIEYNYTLDNREDVLAILNSSLPDAQKKTRIQALDGGVTWRYIINHHMPRLRLATWVCSWVENPEKPYVDTTSKAAEPEKRIRFYFNDSNIDPQYGENAQTLANVVKTLQGIQDNPDCQLKELIFTGTTSPEGKLVYNLPLAERRIATLEKYVRSKVDVPDSVITRNAIGNDWERLTDIVEASNMPNKEETLDVLENIPEHTYDENGKLIDSRKKHLMELQAGRTWNYLAENYFDQLRNAVVELVVSTNPTETPDLEESDIKDPDIKVDEQEAGKLDDSAPKVDTLANPKLVVGPGPVIPQKDTTAAPAIPETQLDTLSEPEVVVPDSTSTLDDNASAQQMKLPVQKERKMIFAGRTNLLVPGLNFGVEIPIGRHVSIGADYYYPWWLAKNNKNCGEMLGWFIDGRYWFTGRDGKYEWTRASKLKGHALGAYAGGGYYDYQKKRSGYQGEYLDLGVDYTFGLPIGRKKWMRMEFNIGLGCILTQARHYTPTSDYEDLIKDPGIKQKYYTWFGPTRASVSFVLPVIVNHKVRNAK